MRSTRAVLMSGLLAAAICSVALSAQVGGSGEPQVLGFQAAADLASPAVFGGDTVPDLVVAPASGTQSTRVFSGVNFGFLGAGFPFNPNFAGGVRVAVGDVNGDGVADVLAGQGPGGSLVTLINGANITVIGSGHPFGAGFRGGVYVATADVNADGLSDIVVGQGTGGGRVMVFSGADISLMMNVAPFGPSFTGGVTVASGDVNADGFADVFVGQASSGGAVALIDGATRGLIASAPVFGNGGVSVALGDVNGDGRADAIMAPFSVNGPVVVYDVLTLTQLAAFVPYGGSSGGVRLASADFNGDGLAEIVTGPGPGGGSTVRVFSGGTFAPLAAVDVYGPGFNGGVFVAAPALRRAAAFTSAAAATFTVGQAGSFTVTTSGNPEVTLITETGALPTGVTFTNNGDGTATISGTPTGPGGSFPLTFNASNGVGSPAAQAFLLTVNQAPTITSAATANFAEGTANSFTVTTTGFPAPQIQRTGNLPSGLTFVDNGNGTATLSGTAADGSAGPHNLTISASNGVGTPASQQFVLTVEPDCPASITFNPPPPALPAGSAGVAYGPIAFTVSASGTYAFTAGPLPSGVILSSAGTLSGTPTTTGTFNVTITATSPAGCTGTAAYTLDIVANAQNDTFLGAVGNTQFVVGAGAPGTPHVLVGGNVLANDAGAGALTVGPPVIAAVNGIVAMAANGTFVYTPAVGFAGPSDTFTYTMTDANGRTDTAVVTIGVGNVVWYVNAGAVGGDGRSHSPFATMTAAANASGPGQAIYVHAGSPAGSTVLQASQTLWGAGAAFTFGNLLIPPVASPTLGGTVTLANNVLVGGLTVNGGGAAAIVATNLTGTETLSQVFITGGVHVFGGTGTMNIGAVITNTAGRSVDIQSFTGGTVTFSGAISDTGQGIFLNGNTGSTIAFTGGMNVSTGTFPAFTATNGGTVVATQNNTAIVNTLATTTAIALKVVDTEIGASGLTFRSVHAGLDGFSAGAGIVLANTGTGSLNGGLTITGDSGGTPASGGVIQRKTGADGSTTEGVGIFLQSTKNPTIHRMLLNNLSNSAIVGRDVHGFLLSDTVIESAGDSVGQFEGPIIFGLPDGLLPGVNGLLGQGTIRNTDVRGGVEDTIAFYNHSGTMALQLENTGEVDFVCQVGFNSVNGGDGLRVQLDGTAQGSVNVEGCRLRNNRLAGVRAVANDSASLIVDIAGSEMVRSVSGHGENGIVLTKGENANLTATIAGSELRGYFGTAIQAGQIPGSASSFTMLGVTIVNTQVLREGGPSTSPSIVALLDSATGLARSRLLVDSNFVEQYGVDPGIFVSAAGAATDAHVTIMNNHVDMHDEPVGTATIEDFGIMVQASQGNLCANIQSNGSHWIPADGPQPGGGIQVEQTGSSTFSLEQGSNPLTDPPATVLFDNNVHPEGGQSQVAVVGAVDIVANDTCQLPSAP